jgi:serine O-acetyltransferase
MGDHLLMRVSADAIALTGPVLPLLDEAGMAARLVREAVMRVVPSIVEDLQSLTMRDAAARTDPDYVYGSYLSFHALLAYRVAHAIHSLDLPIRQHLPTDLRVACAARRISEEAKARTGVEIHPAAAIGRRMVIDHGWGTVIGEHARVGNDCYFLQNVVLGGRKIGIPVSPSRPRHPRIGNRVVIAGDVYIFGPVNIGDDCRIDPGARITSSIPAGSRVRVLTKLQTVENDTVRQATAVL